MIRCFCSSRAGIPVSPRLQACRDIVAHLTLAPSSDARSCSRAPLTVAADTAVRSPSLSRVRWGAGTLGPTQHSMEDEHQAGPRSGGNVGAAQGVVPGCPDAYNLLESSPFETNNRFLYGTPAVRLNAAADSTTRPSRLSSWLSPYLLAWWYSAFQRHVPFSHDGLNTRHIMHEAADRVVHSEHATEEEIDRQFKRRVWALLNDMHADQKWYSLRFGSWLLTHIFKWLYNGEIYVCAEDIQRLRAIADHSTFVCVSAAFRASAACKSVATVGSAAKIAPDRMAACLERARARVPRPGVDAHRYERIARFADTFPPTKAIWTITCSPISSSHTGWPALILPLVRPEFALVTTHMLSAHPDVMLTPSCSTHLHTRALKSVASFFWQQRVMRTVPACRSRVRVQLRVQHAALTGDTCR